MEFLKLQRVRLGLQAVLLHFMNLYTCVCHVMRPFSIYLFFQLYINVIMRTAISKVYLVGADRNKASLPPIGGFHFKCNPRFLPLAASFTIKPMASFTRG